MATVKPQCSYLCSSHLAPCCLEQGHGDSCACSKGVHVEGNRRPVGRIEQTAEAAARLDWANWAEQLKKMFGTVLCFLFLGSFAQAQELNLNVRDVFPRDAWAQGAFLVGRPENFEIARTVLTATVPIGVQTFVVESTAGIPDGKLGLIYRNGQVIDGFDVYVTGPYTVMTHKENRYQFEPGDTLQVAANVDPNGTVLQGVGQGGTLRKVIVKGREVMREELTFDSGGHPRNIRWRKIR